MMLVPFLAQYYQCSGGSASTVFGRSMWKSDFCLARRVHLKIAVLRMPSGPMEPRVMALVLNSITTLPCASRPMRPPEPPACLSTVCTTSRAALAKLSFLC